MTKVFDEANEAIMQKEFKAIRHIYVDMEAMQDFKLGALLSFISVKEEMAYIQSQLPEYFNRTDREIMKYFPVLKITEEQIEKYIQAENNAIKLSITAPFTMIYSAFLQVLYHATQNNKYVEEVASPIRVTFNTSDIFYSESAIKALVTHIKQNVCDITYDITDDKRYCQSIDYYKSHDVLMLSEYDKFLQEPMRAQSIIGKGAWLENRVVSLPFIDPAKEHKAEQTEQILAYTQASADIYFDKFSFVEHGLHQ